MGNMRVVTIGVVFTFSAGRLLADEWPQYRHDAHRTAFSMDSVHPPLRRVWKMELSNLTNPKDYNVRMVAAKGRLFVALPPSVQFYDPYTVLCLDAKSHAVLWKTKHQLWSDSLLFSGGKLFLIERTADSQPHLLALDASSGRKRWEINGSDAGNIPAVQRGRIFISLARYRRQQTPEQLGVVGVKIDTGQLSFGPKLPRVRTSSDFGMCVTETSVIASDSQNLYSITLDGKSTTSWHTPHGIHQPITLRNKLFLVTGRYLQCLQASPLRALWKRGFKEHGSVDLPNPVLTPQGLLQVVGFRRESGQASLSIHLISPLSGRSLWRREMGNLGMISENTTLTQLLVAGDVVWMAAKRLLPASDHYRVRLIAVSRKTGKVLWKGPVLPGDVWQVIVADRKLFVFLEGATLVCYEGAKASNQ